MNSYEKFGLSFVLALTLHLAILAMFGIDFSAEPEVVKVRPLPELIRASILDDEKIQEEAIRLKKNEENKRLKKQKKRQELDDNLKTQQQLLQDAKKKRQLEEQKVKALERKTKELADKQKQQKLKQQKAIEAAKKAKIKKQQEAEAKKNKEKQIAEQKKQKELLAKQQAEAVQKQALLDKQVADEKARAESNRQATISATAAIQQKVIKRWIKPVLSAKGMNCTVRVKLLPSGDVMDVAVIKSSGNDIFDRSAENAVRKASPLPVPKNRALFAKRFRLFTFRFEP
ncbi:MAG: cell envelope integrity protein TolA [Methylococcales symbiont of Hymedesmia sp. n. MRB-2018]|nr:MAG: cell envelope integrity protein TolA [Methylococcales symbiont of Hymedesmia sp. n. MRB-2018]KAF3983545.1 MAG: cell envelope integrity protein TolA [Methylococcales symbiont of Hymedesmia sp. n. MRB-2018]